MRVAFIGEHSNLAIAMTDMMRVTFPEWDIINSYDNHGITGMRFDGRVGNDFYNHGELDAAWEGFVYDMYKARPDLIVNCAGLVNSDKCYGNELSALRANYTTAKNVAEAAGECKAKLVHLGTTASYVDESSAITEDTPPQLKQSAYSLTKLMGEQEVLKLPEEQRLVIRPVFVYGGKYDTSSVIAKLIRRHLAGDTSYVTYNLDLEKIKAPLYITDFAHAVMKLLEQECTGVYVVGNPGGIIKYRTAVRKLAQVGVSDSGVRWAESDDTLGHHYTEATKLLADTALGSGDWPYVNLHAGIRLLLQELSNVK